MRRACIAAALAVALAVPALALQPDEMLKDPALEARARALSAELRCLVCQNQSIDDSDATLARDLRILIRERLAAGDSDEAAKDFVVARYGEYVLLKPRLSAKTAVLWLAPFLILAAAAAALLFRRRKPAEQERPLSAEEQRALDDITKSPQV